VHRGSRNLPSYEIIDRIKKLGIICFMLFFPAKKAYMIGLSFHRYRVKKAEFWINMKAGLDIRAVDFGKE